MIVVEQMTRSVKGTDKNITYLYRLIKNTVNLSLDFDSLEVQAYGIEIERQDEQNCVITNIERDSILTISPYRHKVHELVKLLYDNEVSPIHLVDVVGEYVDTWVDDFDTELKIVSTN